MPKAREMLAVAIVRFESRFTHILNSRPQFLSPTGETHLEVVSKGGGTSIRCQTAENAVFSWLENATQMVPAGANTLYWRTRPEIDHNRDGWAVYGRFCATNKSEEN
jgi:hypothetical protein